MSTRQSSLMTTYFALRYNTIASAEPTNIITLKAIEEMVGSNPMVALAIAAVTEMAVANMATRASIGSLEASMVSRFNVGKQMPKLSEITNKLPTNN